MARRMGFFPNLFLETLGVSERRPAWFVLLLSAMATAALYAACLAAIALLGSRSRGGPTPLAPAQFAFTILFIWAEATLWYHLVYVAKYHWEGMGETVEERHVEFWGSAPVMLVLLTLKLLWFAFKYAVAPLLPIFLVIVLQEIPDIGPVLRDATCVVFILYPIACATLYLLRHGAIGRGAKLPDAGRRG